MNITTIIRSIRNIMRKDEGVDGDAQRISQMVWMLFMKIFADKEDEWKISRKEYKSPIPEKLKWQNWAADEDGLTGEELIEFINEELFPLLKAIHPTDTDQSVIIKSVFNDTYNYMKSGNLFRQVVNEINKIDFSSKNKDIHVFNEIYESILKELQSAGSSGEFYTPRAVTQFMVEMVNPQIGESILDPACGTGGFLTCSLDHLSLQKDFDRASLKIQESIRGVEKKPLPHLLCTTNLILHGIEKPAITRGNLLSIPYDSWNTKNQVNIVLSNPPFGGQEEDGTEKNFPKEFRTKETADLFLALIIKILKKNGRAAVVLPDSSLSGEGVKKRIREELLEKCNLHTIIRLPNGIFNPYTSIKTNLLFFEKGKPTKEVWYYEMPYPKGIKNFNKSRSIDIDDFQEIKNWWIDRKENDFASKISIEEIKDKSINLDIKNMQVVVRESNESTQSILKALKDSLKKSEKILLEIEKLFE
ncbi:N-6 DNA methylase [Elizabethkingia anophelis]|uniref:class I SAM-dependent DNA methyltransferase n=2 Tax=Elizabethkingia anophelis TaxID=1117645 RepID=UPI00136A7455|nr:N-6 DNA methylase [Elizabethkingia anophelis]MCT4228426.1 N-6 DNA methylase [Elizabethkingia anophelis]MCT4239152.1 N-6 DNA methylase [Elizabethkingia anophelis]MCT4282277.1 N-6 DNA methylase [Elizabethkingia anophelis]MCT4292862.1 N-6 DNA methylase [Elizabethkingia anophelis]MYY28158.1 SAM-dependent DNA methyltransferase [Elizabethkingia anophelis]